MATQDVPPDFVCPITMEVMKHPLATRYGQNYERSAIIAWLAKGSHECPLTRKPLKISDLIHNNRLAYQIKLWQVAHNLIEPDTVDPKKETDDTEGSDDKLVCMYGTMTDKTQPTVGNVSQLVPHSVALPSQPSDLPRRRVSPRTVWNRFRISI